MSEDYPGKPEWKPEDDSETPIDPYEAEAGMVERELRKTGRITADMTDEEVVELVSETIRQQRSETGRDFLGQSVVEHELGKIFPEDDENSDGS